MGRRSKRTLPEKKIPGSQAGYLAKHKFRSTDCQISLMRIIWSFRGGITKTRLTTDMDGSYDTVTIV